MGNLDLQRISVSNGHAPSSPDPKPSHEGSNTVIASTMASVVLAIGALGAATADDSRAALRQSSEYEKSKDYPKAIEALLPTHAAHAQDYLLNERLGWLYYLSGRYDDAQRYYQEAVKARPQAIEAKLGCLLPMLAGEALPGSRGDRRDVLTVDPWSYYGNLRLAVALRGQKKVAEAMQVVQRMLVVYPADPYYRAERALLGAAPPPASTPAEDPGMRDAMHASLQHETNRDYASAISALSAQQQAHPEDYTVNLRLGWLNYFSGDYDASSRCYYKAVRITPKSVEAGLGYLLPLLAQRALTRTPSRWPAKSSPATPATITPICGWPWCRDGSCKYAEAEKIVARMLDTYPADTPLMLEMGLLCVAQDKKPEARNWLSDVLALAPDNATAAERLRAL